MSLGDLSRKALFENAARERTLNQAFCFLCERQTLLLTLRQAAQLCQRPEAEILRAAKGGAIHRLHNSRGTVLICRSSLEQLASDVQITLPLSLEISQDLEAV